MPIFFNFPSLIICFRWIWISSRPVFQFNLEEMSHAPTILGQKWAFLEFQADTLANFFLVSLCSVCKHLHCHCNFHCHFTCFPLFTFLQTTRFFMGLVFLESGAWYKVNRCLARYSSRVTTTNQPTNSAPNEPARPICAQESIFWGKNWPFLGQKP